MGHERAELPDEEGVERMKREVAEPETVDISQEAGGPQSPTVNCLDASDELGGEQIRGSGGLSRSASGRWLDLSELS